MLSVLLASQKCREVLFIFGNVKTIATVAVVLFIYSIYVYLCVPECICVHHMHMTAAHRSQKGVLDPLGLE